MFGITLFCLAIAAIGISVSGLVHGHPAPGTAVTDCSSQAPIAGMTCHDFWSEELDKNIPIWINTDLTAPDNQPEDTSTQHPNNERSVTTELDADKSDTIPKVTPIDPSIKGKYKGPLVTIPQFHQEPNHKDDPWIFYSSDAHHETCRNAEMHFENTTVAPDPGHCGYLVAYFTAFGGRWWLNPAVADQGWHTTLAYVETDTGSCSVMVGFDYKMGQSVPPTSLDGMDIGDADIKHWLSFLDLPSPVFPVDHGPVHARGTADCWVSDSWPGTFNQLKWAVTRRDDWGIVETVFPDDPHTVFPDDPPANTPRDLQTRQSQIPKANATLDYQFSRDSSGKNYTQCRNDQAKAIPLIGTPYLDNCRIIQEYFRKHTGSFKVAGKDLAPGSQHQLVHADSPRGSCTIVVGNNGTSPIVAADAQVLIGNEDIIRWLGTGVTLISNRDGPGYAKGTSECVNGNAFHEYAGLHWAMTRTVEKFGWDDLQSGAVESDAGSVTEQNWELPPKFTATQGAIPRRNRAARKNVN